MTFEEILSELKVTFVQAGSHHHARPGWINLDCPFCGGDSGRFHLGFNIASKYTFCWKCGHHHLDRVLEALGCPRARAVELARSVDTEIEIKRDLAPSQLVVPRSLGPLLPAHKRYLRGRGFDPGELEVIWKIKGIGIAHKLAWRIYIPVTRKGKQVSWTTRAIGEDVGQRYISAPAANESRNIKETVYGLEACHHSIVIVEGPTDAWAIGPGAGALFGTVFTPAQVNELVSIPRRVVCFDASPPAQAQATKLAEQLSCFPGITENVCLDAADPGSASPAELRLLRRFAGI